MRIWIRFLQKEKFKVLLGNFLSLLSVKMINIIQPVVVLPYLTRTLGPELFGLIAFAQSLMEYFVVIIDYGFNLTATRDISKKREDDNEVNRIFSNIFFTKLLLLLVSMTVLFILIFTIERFKTHYALYLFSSLAVIGQAAFPIWFFQGIEKMKYISILNVVAKVFFTICIFIFIRDGEDFIFVPLLNGLGFVIVALLSFLIVVNKYKIRLIFPKFSEIWQSLKEGSSIFISNLAPNLYNNSATFFLGLFSSNTVTGYFSGVVKIVNFFVTLVTVTSQTFYPHLAKNPRSFRPFLFIMLGSGLILSLIILIFSKLLVDLLLGPEFEVTRMYLMVFAVSVYQVSSLNAFRNYFLIHYHDALIRNINIPISLGGFFIMLASTYYFGIWGTILGLIFIRFVLSATYFFYFRKFEKKP